MIHLSAPQATAHLFFNRGEPHFHSKELEIPQALTPQNSQKKRGELPSRLDIFGHPLATAHGTPASIWKWKIRKTMTVNLWWQRLANSKYVQTSACIITLSGLDGTKDLIWFVSITTIGIRMVIYQDSILKMGWSSISMTLQTQLMYLNLKLSSHI